MVKPLKKVTIQPGSSVHSVKRAKLLNSWSKIRPVPWNLSLSLIHSTSVATYNVMDHVNDDAIVSMVFSLTITPRVHVGYELAIIISYPTSASGIIVLTKTPTKYREFFPALFVNSTDFQLVFNFEQTRT